MILTWLRARRERKHRIRIATLMAEAAGHDAAAAIFERIVVNWYSYTGGPIGDPIQLLAAAKAKGARARSLAAQLAEHGP